MGEPWWGAEYRKIFPSCSTYKCDPRAHWAPSSSSPSLGTSTLQTISQRLPRTLGKLQQVLTRATLIRKAVVRCRVNTGGMLKNSEDHHFDYPAGILRASFFRGQNINKSWASGSPYECEERDGRRTLRNSPSSCFSTNARRHGPTAGEPRSLTVLVVPSDKAGSSARDDGE